MVAGAYPAALSPARQVQLLRDLRVEGRVLRVMLAVQRLQSVEAEVLEALHGGAELGVVRALQTHRMSEDGEAARGVDGVDRAGSGDDLAPGPYGLSILLTAAHHL